MQTSLKVVFPEMRGTRNATNWKCDKLSAFKNCDLLHFFLIYKSYSCTEMG